jgi:hypothetical protein
VADGFNPQGNAISELCWWGAYFDGVSGDCQGVALDTFEVQYYEDADGAPGAPLGPRFSQEAGTLNVIGPVPTPRTVVGLPEYEYTASHAPVTVTPGQCVWVEISNSVSGSLACFWYWEEGATGEGRLFQDGDPLDGYGSEDIRLGDQAFCVDQQLGDPLQCLPQAPPNDDCINSTSVTDGVIFFDTFRATTDGPPAPIEQQVEVCGFIVGDGQIHQDIWFDYVATCSDVLEVSLWGSSFDTRLGVYAGSDCPSEVELLAACNDDDCGPQQSRILLPVTQGEAYKIRVGGKSGQAGPGRLKITCGTPPPNDNCADAPIIDLPIGSSHVYEGNNELATNECGLFSPCPHVWIAFNLPEAAWVTLEYCGTDPAFDAAWTRLALECPCTGATDEAICDFECPGADTNPLISWGCLPAGVYYYPVLAAPGSVGPYTITVTADLCDRCADATGDCFQDNGTPGCDDPSCCATVCAADPYCCCVQWDAFCAQEAEALCGGFAAFCADATGLCCEAHAPGAGCGNPACCEAVCDFDAWCCTREWDQLCADEAASQCGTFCLGCQDGNVTFDSPADGFLDARQPHDLNDAGLLQGVTEFEVTAPANDDDIACWELCETNNNPALHTGLPANDIASVVNHGDGSYTIALVRPIAAGEVGTLSYTSYTGATAVTGVFTSHPADTDGDGTSAPADILAVIDSLNGVVPLPDARGDVDRDGTQAPADILRVIDLLNGAAAFQPCNGVMIDPTGCP